MFRNDTPLWLPPGSVRAVLALAVTGAYLVSLFTNTPQPPETVVGLVLGSYFVGRQTSPPSGTSDV